MNSQYDCGLRGGCQSRRATACVAVCFEPLETRQLLAATLDESFGDDGVTEVGPMATFAVGPDDRIVTADAGTITRHTAEGGVDTSFGGGDGRVATDLSVIRGFAVQQDGKIVVVGQKSRRGGGSVFGVARYTSAGKLDKSFSGDGIYTKSFGGGKNAWDYASDAAIQPNGKIVVVGHGTTDRASHAGAMITMRLKANGRLDKTFHDKGYSASHPGSEFGALQHEGLDVELAPGGKIVVGGVAAWSAVIVRYNRDGSLDRTFGGDGIASPYFPLDSLSLDVQPDGKVVFAGTSRESRVDTGDRVLRLTVSGELDPAFGGGDGIVQDLFEVHDSYSSSANDVLVLPDGDILVAGDNEDRATDINRATLSRLNPDGSIDPQFAGGETYIEIPFGGDALAHELSLQSDGGVVVSGANFRVRKLARYVIDGAS